MVLNSSETNILSTKTFTFFFKLIVKEHIRKTSTLAVRKMVIPKDGSLESQFLKSEDGKPLIFERKSVEYEDYSSSFREKVPDFSKQFFHMYACRLEELRGILLKAVEKKWGNIVLLTIGEFHLSPTKPQSYPHYIGFGSLRTFWTTSGTCPIKNIPIVKLADLEHHEDKRSVIIGTLYKHQQWKPSILRELSEETEEVIVETRDDYCDENDQPFLEDEMLRIKLVGDKVDVREIVTGVVCAVLGKKTEAGTFAVEDWCFPGCPPQPSVQSTARGKLVLLSTLDLMHNVDALSMDLLAEWVNGMAGNIESQSDQAEIVRVLIAGNSISNQTVVKSEKDFLTNATQTNEAVSQVTKALSKLDEWLDGILGQCCVTLMPGQHDPTNCMLPQKPLQRFVLKKSSRYASFQNASNPWIGKIGNRSIVGSSGQPVEDIQKVCGKECKLTPLDWLEKTLIWRHLCPTAPDTLPSNPYYEKDLFILKDCPNIYFISNVEKFETKLWKGENGQVVRLICVPRFCSSKCAVLVDLETLDTETISFGTS